MIEKYTFGQIIIDGKKYTSDVIIYPNRVDDNWWRKDGHELSLEDIREIPLKELEALVVGTGNSGFMKVLPETGKYLKSKNIRLIAEETEKACQTYNHLCKTAKVIAALHLTC